MSQLRLARIAAAMGTLFFLVHGLSVILAPERSLMGWLYDDCFYYLITAKHLFEQHRSSFDGITLTSGYHPLWAWICVAVYGLHRKLDLTYLRLCMGVSWLITSLVLLGVLRWSLRKGNVGWLWAIALSTTSYSALNNGITVMEWPLVILFWTLLHCLLVRQASGDVSGVRRNVIAMAAALGFFGSLARTDFGLIPAVYLIAGLFIARRLQSWRPFFAATSAVGGSAAGLGTTFLYNHIATGSWIQQSAQIKHLLANSSSPFNPAPAAWQFMRVLFYLPPLDLSVSQRVQFLRYGVLMLGGIALIAGGAIVYHLRRPKQAGEARPPEDVFVTIAALCGIAGYLTVYSFNSEATFGWYTATVTGFVLVLASQFFSRMGSRIAAAITLPLIALNLAGLVYGGPTARSQYVEVRIGLALRRDHAGALMGGGDVGKASFYNGGTMINLDGLMNNEIYPYLAAGEFPCYFLVRRIEYVSNLGSITLPIVAAQRKARHLPPMDWRDYFISHLVHAPDGVPVTYYQTDFDAIQRSGECPVPAH